MSRRIGIISWDGTSDIAKVIRIVAEVEQEPQYERNRFNDGKADPNGRVFAGTMRFEECVDIPEVAEGTLYRFTRNQPAGVAVLNDIAIANGLTWNAATHKFYYVDTCACNIREFNYDIRTGNICKFLFFFHGNIF